MAASKGEKRQLDRVGGQLDLVVNQLAKILTVVISEAAQLHRGKENKGRNTTHG